MTDFNFYQINNEITKSLFILLDKIANLKKKILIFSEETDFLQQLDHNLWSYGKVKFLPHATIWDKQFDHKTQPIFLTNTKINTNLAENLIVFSPIKGEFLYEFSKIMYFFTPYQKQEAKKFYNFCKERNNNISFFKKENNLWTKLLNFD